MWWAPFTGSLTDSGRDDVAFQNLTGWADSDPAAQMQFKNMTGRSKLLICQKFSLRIETQVEQLRFVLDRVQSMLDQHPLIESGTSRVRVTNVVGAAFALELFAYGKTGDWAQFTAIRQDVILKIAEIIEASMNDLLGQVGRLHVQ